MIATQQGARDRERVLRVISVATFAIFFQAFMVAPIIPILATSFGAAPQTTGLIVPAYLIPYGAATLVYGLLADRLGLRPVMTASLAAFSLLTAATATAETLVQLAVWRLVTGLGAAGVVPLALVLVGRLYPYEERGRPLGWLFGAMAGGMAFGSSFGALLEPYVGWRGIFVAVGLVGGGVLVALRSSRPQLDGMPAVKGSLRALFRAYRQLLTSQRGKRTYVYVLLNSVFHSGVFTWLGLYLQQRYGLGPVGIGLALLGYGIPGFLFGPIIGRAADRWGRGRLLPLGLLLGAIAAAALMVDAPLVAAAAAITVLSLGYDMTQPMFAGIVTSLGGQRPGQAMGLNVCALFTGFGLGALLFGEAVRLDFDVALGVFALAEFGLALAALRLFRSEIPRSEAP